MYEQDLLRTLSLHEGLRLAIFACACAERMSPCMIPYEEKFGSKLPDQTRSALQLCWDYLGGPLNGFNISSDGLARMIMDTDHPDWNIYRIYLDDPVASAVLAMNVVSSGNIDDAFAAATFSTLDFLDAHLRRVDPKMVALEIGALESVPLIRAEISRQLRDAAELAALKTVDADVVSRFRRRAESEPILPGLVL